MKKILLAFTLAAITFPCLSQTYNNEWIDYTKIYYKFKVGANGLYRIGQPTLATAGLHNAEAQDFQLWHNGVEVPVFTSVSTGILSASDFIEFYGEINDGKLDTKLYKTDETQMSDKYSLYTDTSAYYLTVNPGSPNKRLINTANPVAENTLGAEPYFMHTLERYFKQRMNPGFGYDLGELVHAASYEDAEGWTGNTFGPGGSYNDNNTNLFTYAAGPAATFNAVVSGNKDMNRTINIKINSTTYLTEEFYGYYIRRYTVNNIPATVFQTNNAAVEFRNSGTTPGDQLVVSNYSIKYPRLFNFGGQSVFPFELAASDTGKYLTISNFNHTGGTPVLYDLTNNLRITADVVSGIVRFALPSSPTVRKFILLSTTPAVVRSISSLTQRNFINYGSPENQGDYLIISHSTLFNDGAGNNNIEKYRQYRSSVDGGSFNAKIADIDQLTDQFSFGVKHHPSAIRNFSQFVTATYTSPVKYFFLIGKGLNYNSYKTYESDININKLALIPTFGFPASDNLLTASRTGEYPLIPIGRLSAINGIEVGDYLEKIKQFELVQKTTAQSIDEKSWMKNIAQLTGGLDDPGLESLITNYMNGYQAIASDTLFGGKVYQFIKNTGSNSAVGSTKTLQDLFNEGLSLLTYFGHSSPNIIEFNLDNPEYYNNTGKYPLIIINGCNAGNLFVFDTLRAVNKGTLSEKFVFAKNKGSIGYIASTHFGLPAQLNFVNKEFYKNLCNKMYGLSLGKIMQTTMKDVFNDYGADYITQTHVEEITLHGDPALVLNPQSKPDYVTQDSLINFNPSVVSVADDKVLVTVKMLNIGKSIKDSLAIKIQHTLPDNSVVTIFNGKIKAVSFEDSIKLALSINPLRHVGINQISVVIDENDLISELSESNNTASRSFTILANEIRPIWPYQYAIINNPSVELFGSTSDPLANNKDYIMEMDTTTNFNSPLKVTQTINSSGGIVKFTPGIPLTDSTVYYWRLSNGPVDANTHWQNSSFVYINSNDSGYNQSHYYQYKNDNFDQINIHETSREFNFNDRVRRLLIRTGLYPYYNWDQININVDAERVEQYGCRYNSIQFAVFDPLTMKPWQNTVSGGFGRFGSWNCGSTRYIFEFPYTDTSYRRKAMQMFDSIPNGYYVTITNLGNTSNTSFINQWKADTTKLGSGKSLWHKFHEMGLHKIDSFTTNLPFLFAFRKGDTTSFPIEQSIGPSLNNQIIDAYDISGKDVSGSVSTPWFGPAKKWKSFKWDEAISGISTTVKRFEIIGRNLSGTEVVLANVYNAKDSNISFIDAEVQPYLKLKIYNTDNTNAKATQLKYWMLNAEESPEGALAPNILFHKEDSLKLADTLHFRIAFKNVSPVAFDSIKVRLTIIDQLGGIHINNNIKLKALIADDTAIIAYDVPANLYPGQNQLIVDVNPDNDQPEQFHFNNVLYTSFVVENAICPGNNTSFYAGNPTPGNTYKWQVNDGSGYKNVVNDHIYSGATAPTLQLNSPPTSMYGYTYRCILTNNEIPLASSEFSLKFVSYWTGATDITWEDPGNWRCNIVPDASTDVQISSGLGNYPMINSNANCRSIFVQPGASVTLTTDSNLNITGKSTE